MGDLKFGEFDSILTVQEAELDFFAMTNDISYLRIVCRK